MLANIARSVGALLLMTAVVTTETQDVEKAKAFRCFVENGVSGSGEPGKAVEYTPDRFSANPADSIFTVDVTGSRLTGNAGAQDVKIIRDKDVTDILTWSVGHLVSYSIFHDIPATMPKAAGGLVTKGYRMVTSRHLSVLGNLSVSQYAGVCVVTD